MRQEITQEGAESPEAVEEKAKPRAYTRVSTETRRLGFEIAVLRRAHQVRDKGGWTHKAVAEKLECSIPLVARAEKGLVSLPFLITLCRLYNQKVVDVLLRAHFESELYDCLAGEVKELREMVGVP